MSLGVTHASGRARALSILAVAMLLASLAFVTTSAVRPTTALGATASCNATYHPPTADRIQVSFTNLTIAGDGSGIYLDPTNGRYYTTASSAANASEAPATINFLVTSGDFSGSDIWCVLVNQSPVGSRKGNDLDDKGTGEFRGSTALSGFAEGDEVCITAMISSADGQGAPKNRACFTVGRHSITATGSLAVRVTTGNAPSGGTFTGTWTCSNSTSGSWSATANLVGGTAVTSGLPVGTTCTVTPVAGPGGEGWIPGLAQQVTIAAGDNTVLVGFTPPGGPEITPDPCVVDPASCAEVLDVVTTPPSDGLAASTGSTAPALGVLLLILAAIVGALGLLTPASKRIRR